MPERIDVAGDRPLAAGSGHISYGVGDASPIKRLRYTGDGAGTYILHVDTTIEAAAFAPQIFADDVDWIRENLGTYTALVPEFIASCYQFSLCVDDGYGGAPWDVDGDLWFTFALRYEGQLATEADMLAVALKDTEVYELNRWLPQIGKESWPMIGDEYRGYLGVRWSKNDFGEAGVDVPCPAMERIFLNSLEQDFTKALGFVARVPQLTTIQKQAIDNVMRTATGHPEYVAFATLDLDEASDDLDAVLELTHEVLTHTLRRFRCNEHYPPRMLSA